MQERHFHLEAQENFPEELVDRLQELAHYISYNRSKRAWKRKWKSLSPVGFFEIQILQARILQWVAFPFSRVFSQPRSRTQVSPTAGGFFTIWATREAQGLMGNSKSMFSQRALWFKQEETHRNDPKTKFHECKDSVCVICCYSPLFGSPALGTHIVAVE